MNLKPHEIQALIQNYAKTIAEDYKPRSDGEYRILRNKPDLIETLERMLQLAKELP